MPKQASTQNTKDPKYHPKRLTRPVYNLEELDDKWNYLLACEVDLLADSIAGMQAEELSLREKLREAAEQSTENIGHDDATQESIRLTLWTLSSRLDHLRAAHIHHTVLPEPDKVDKATFGCLIELSGSKGLKVALVGGADLPLQRPYVPDDYAPVTYLSPIGAKLFAARVGEAIEVNNVMYRVESISVL